MDMSYFRMVNNSYKSKSKQESNLYIVNREVNKHFADTIDYHVVEKNGKPFELIIIKDTDGNTTQKKIKSRPNEYFNLGDYIKWNGQMWLVVKVDPNTKTFNSGYMYLCNTCLRWQNKSGEIIEKWCNIQDYTKYSSGIYNNGTIIIGDNQYGCIMPVDNDTRNLKRESRFAVDVDGVDIPDIYKLTNKKPVIDNYESFGRGAIMTVILSYTEFNKDTDKCIELDDGRKVWICDYNLKSHDISKVQEDLISDNEELTTITATIFGKDKLKMGYYRDYKVKFYDYNSVELNIQDYTWAILNTINSVELSGIADGCRMTCKEDYSIVGEVVQLGVLIGTKLITSIDVEITDIYG